MSSKKHPPCPACGHESWPIAYGMMMPDEHEKHPETVFAGCVVVEDERINPQTGEYEHGYAKWECQNPDCRNQWW